MKLELRRRWLSDESTVGELYADGERLCFVLEDRYRGDALSDKVPGKSAIPCGVYEIIITHSPRFGVDMPLLLNVPGFKGVRIHWGNDPEDTDGCLITGTEREPNKVLHSRVAYGVVFQAIQAARARGENVHIDIQISKEIPNA